MILYLLVKKHLLFKGRKEIGIKMTQKGIAVYVVKNYVSQYNFAVDLFNQSSFEVNLKNEPYKRKMRGGRFLLLNPVILTVIIATVITFPIGFGLLRDILNGTLLAMTILYFIVTGYNTHVYRKNGNIIATNFILEPALVPAGYINELYEIELSSLEQTIIFNTNYTDRFRRLVTENNVSIGTFIVMFYRDKYRSYTRCACKLGLYYALFTVLLILNIFQVSVEVTTDDE